MNYQAVETEERMNRFMVQNMSNTDSAERWEMKREELIHFAAMCMLDNSQISITLCHGGETVFSLPYSCGDQILVHGKYTRFGECKERRFDRLVEAIEDETELLQSQA